jgi:hypothetical protein
MSRCEHWLKVTAGILVLIALLGATLATPLTGAGQETDTPANVNDEANPPASIPENDSAADVDQLPASGSGGHLPSGASQVLMLSLIAALGAALLVSGAVAVRAKRAG